MTNTFRKAKDILSTPNQFPEKEYYESLKKKKKNN